MNDFTKEELDYILNILVSTNVNQVNSKVIDKTRSMIDNYCDHEWENYYSGRIVVGIYCSKCNKHLKGS